MVIFPFVARLKNGNYKYNNEIYSMKNHGLVRYNNLYILDQSSSLLILGFDYNEDTLKQYPYKFHFEVSYELIDNELIISYKIQNLDNKIIYYGFGGHPAIKTSGYEENDKFIYDNTSLLFKNDIKTKRYVLDEAGYYILGDMKDKLPKELLLNKDFITKEKTLIYDAKDINKLTLITNNYSFEFNISEAEILTLWTSPGLGDYICVEPWWGLPDYINPAPELKDKPLIHSLNIGEVETKKYSIKINKN